MTIAGVSRLSISRNCRDASIENFQSISCCGLFASFSYPIRGGKFHVIKSNKMVALTLRSHLIAIDSCASRYVNIHI